MENNIDRYILLLKNNVTENLKILYSMFKKIGKKWAFLCNPRALFKKISIILALFWQKTSTALSI